MNQSARFLCRSSDFSRDFQASGLHLRRSYSIRKELNVNSFADFGLLPTLLTSLKEKHFYKPTPIQAQTIPMLMGGLSVVGVSATGSGKTLAYALPLLHQLKSLEIDGQPAQTEKAPRGVVIVPTRELGEQVAKVFKTLTHDTRLRVRTALGGTSLEQARRNTSGVFEILLATPGRLIQMIDNEQIDLTDVRMVILDEADQMMDQGFIKETKTILRACVNATQMALFSATVSESVQDLINREFKDAEFIRSQDSGKVVSSLTTKNLMVKDGKRWPLFEKVLAQRSEGGTMVFVNTREQCDKLAKELADKGYHCAVYRGEMDKLERRSNLKKFRDGKIDLLVSTDLAGRGLDIENVGRVINYHLPQQMENYLHRAGRTARAGRKGLVINLVTERDSRLIAKLAGEKKPSHVGKPKKPSQGNPGHFAKAMQAAKVPTAAKPAKKKPAAAARKRF